MYELEHGERYWFDQEEEKIMVENNREFEMCIRDREKIANVGSDGTDILVKAMVNIMLINVFKEKASRKFGAVSYTHLR